MVKKTKGLGGKGLGALLKNSQASISEEKSIQDKELRDLPVELIQRGQYQPRRDMDPTALEELAESIKQQGVMQPIVDRRITEGRYEIVAGGRRWRATQLAGMDKIPAIIREINDEAAIAMALIENIQRENLNPIEEAMALQRLQNEFGLTQQQVAEAVGKSRTTITNLLRLIGLHPEVRIMLEHGDIEMGHGKALLGLSEAEQLAAAKVVIARSLSVRQTEALVRKLQQKKEEVKTPVVVDPDITRLERDLAERIGAQVAISHGTQGKGKVVIQYNSLDELDGILAHIK